MPRCMICNGSSEIDPEFFNVSFYWDPVELGWLCAECVSNIPTEEEWDENPSIPEDNSN